MARLFREQRLEHQSAFLWFSLDVVFAWLLEQSSIQYHLHLPGVKQNLATRFKTSLDILSLSKDTQNCWQKKRNPEKFSDKMQSQQIFKAWELIYKVSSYFCPSQSQEQTLGTGWQRKKWHAPFYMKTN